MALKHESFEELFTATADAIRTQTGSSDPIVADDFPEIISTLSAGPDTEEVEELIAIHNTSTTAHSDIRTSISSLKTSVNDLNTSVSTLNTTVNDKADAVHTQNASTITAGTFAGSVSAKAGSQSSESYLLRNTKISSEAEAPTVIGQICWKRV